MRGRRQLVKIVQATYGMFQYMYSGTCTNILHWYVTALNVGKIINVMAMSYMSATRANNSYILYLPSFYV